MLTIDLIKDEEISEDGEEWGWFYIEIAGDVLTGYKPFNDLNFTAYDFWFSALESACKNIVEGKPYYVWEFDTLTNFFGIESLNDTDIVFKVGNRDDYWKDARMEYIPSDFKLQKEYVINKNVFLAELSRNGIEIT